MRAFFPSYVDDEILDEVFCACAVTICFYYYYYYAAELPPSPRQRRL